MIFDNTDSFYFEGFLAVPGAAGGNFVGGFLIRCLKLKIRGQLRACVVLSLICALLVLSFLMRCSDIYIAGVTSPYNNQKYVVPVRKDKYFKITYILHLYL